MAKDFNFARKPFENERLPRLVFTLAAAVVLGITLVHGFFLARYLVREQEALDIKVVELRQALTDTDTAISRTEASLARQQTALSDERTVFLTRIYRHKSFSWTGLFNELEQITPAAVRITSIAPFEDDGEIAVTMSLVGRTLGNVLEMVSALEGSSFFATVFPLDEVDLAELGDGTETGIAATVQLRYVSATPKDEAHPPAGATAESSSEAVEDNESEGEDVDDPALSDELMDDDDLEGDAIDDIDAIDDMDDELMDPLEEDDAEEAPIPSPKGVP